MFAFRKTIFDIAPMEIRRNTGIIGYIFVNDRSTGLHGFHGIKYGRKLLIRHIDQPKGPFRGGVVNGRNGCNLFADISDFSVGDRVFIRTFGAVTAF